MAAPTVIERDCEFWVVPIEVGPFRTHEAAWT